MAEFRFTPYDRLTLLDSRGMAFKCANGDEYKVNYRFQLSGPGVLKREGERLVWTLFFGGIPRYMKEKEIEDRRNTTLKRMVTGNETVLKELIEYAEKAIWEGIESASNEEDQKRRKAIAEEALYDPQKFGLAEHLIRPEVGMHLATGLVVFNPLTQNENLRQRLRTVISRTPIAEIYCLPPEESRQE